MSAIRTETVLSVRHWTDRLFSFTTTRDAGFRFRSGQFAMIGLQVNGRPLLRAYSMASATYEDELGFFSIKVPEGPLTSRLQHLRPGDEILVGGKATGTLVQESLRPGRVLYLVGTGTGLAPFLSLVKDPELYERFETVVLTHGCRRVAELAYRETIAEELPGHEFLGDAVRRQLIYYPAVTREAFRNTGRVTELVRSGRLAADCGLPPLEPAHDRVMLCGGPAMLRDMRGLLGARGFAEGSNARPAELVYEKAFVDHEAVAA